MCEQGEKDYHYSLPPIHVRPASADEAAPYLARPLFSSCTVPIVYYSHYLQNVAHMFRGEWQGAACTAEVVPLCHRFGHPELPPVFMSR
jgi:hypothetical protein